MIDITQDHNLSLFNYKEWAQDRFAKVKKKALAVTTPMIRSVNGTSNVVQYPEAAVAIKRLRKDLGFKQDEFADIFEVKKNTISRWERGSTKPDKHRVICVLDSLPKNVTTVTIQDFNYDFDYDRATVRHNSQNNGACKD